MKKSLLLHALSLNDRILEPNRLPLKGRVWAYDKSACSREMFVGNCITMLSLMGMQDAHISWKDDIMAFDVSCGGHPYTVVISLKDDSLASEYFYFLGIWECPEERFHATLPSFDDMIDWSEEDLLAPDVSYSITLTDLPLQQSDIQQLIGTAVFSETTYGGKFHLCGTLMPGERHTGNFVVFPTRQLPATPHAEVQHLLYSMRNLIALTAKATMIHQAAFNEDDSELATAIETMGMQLADKPGAEALAALAGRAAMTALRASQDATSHMKQIRTVNGIERLFQTITDEMDIGEAKGSPRLLKRILMPVTHARDLLDERLETLDRLEDQARILQQWVATLAGTHE